MPIGQWLAMRIYSKVCKCNSDVKMSLQPKSEFTYDFGVLFFTEVKWGGGTSGFVKQLYKQGK